MGRGFHGHTLEIREYISSSMMRLRRVKASKQLFGHWTATLDFDCTDWKFFVKQEQLGSTLHKRQAKLDRGRWRLVVGNLLPAVGNTEQQMCHRLLTSGVARLVCPVFFVSRRR